MRYNTVFCAAVGVLLCLSCGQATQIVPVVNYFGVKQGDGDRDTSKQLCLQHGGYPPSDISTAHHTQLITTAHDLGVGSEWYAYLGGDTYVPDSRFCSPDALHGGSEVVSCGWHWNQGRWLYLQDNNLTEIYTPHSGILFYTGNKHLLNGADEPQNGFPSFFNSEGDFYDINARPGFALGRSLLLVGQDTGAVWSDNLDAGGYIYKNSNVSSNGKFIEDPSSVEATRSFFITLCEVQPMYRETYELFNTSSHIQQNWWAVLFAIFFVIALVGFIITAACQEREDMDEPPEDAPEWAAKQQSSRHSKSFISTRSFRQYNDDNGGSTTREDDYGAEGADNYAAQDRQHSFREGNNQNPLADPGYLDQGSHHPSMRDNWM